MTAKKISSYEEALEEVKDIVRKIEQGDNTVDELSKMVQRALDLIDQCKTKLRSTEESIQNLFNENDGEVSN